MDNEILFSVCLITYNQEDYIKQTIDSIMSQSQDYKYEIVIGDDCSQDKTSQIIRDYEKQYPDIIKPEYNAKNKGLIKNYFDTLSRCKGKYIMDIGGDDWWLPGKVKSQIDFMESHLDVGLCYGKSKVYSQKKQRFTNTIIGTNNCDFVSLLDHNCVPALTMCSRNVLVKQYLVDIDPLNRTWKMEDYPILLWFSKESKIAFLDEVQACYRYISDSISHFVNIDKLISFRDSENDIRNFFVEKYHLGVKYISDSQNEKCKFLAHKKGISHKMWIEEYKKIPELKKSDKFFYIVCKNAFLFHFYRIYLLIMKKMID